MKVLAILGVVALVIALLLGGTWFYFAQIANPRVERELVEDPDGARAQKVMLLTLPSGRRIPVNYLREDGMVYAGADGRWWQELASDGGAVTVLVRGETLTGHARAIEADPAYTKRIFAKLRPNAVEGFGTLIEIRLGPPDGS